MIVTMTDDETEVRRARRSWPAQYKLDILNEIEAAKESGETTVAEICRREGLYSSLISEWRKQRDDGALEGLRDRKPGRPKKDRSKAELARLRARVAELEDELDTAHELIETQGKVSALLQEMSQRSAERNTKKP
jgi:transposase